MQIADLQQAAPDSREDTRDDEPPALTVQQMQVMPRIEAAAAKARAPLPKKRKCSAPKAECKLPSIRRDSVPMTTFTYAVKKGNNSRLILSTLR